MKQLTKDRIVQIITVLTFILMVSVNALANILPINGVGSGEVSDSYPNLFAPIGYTFSIWGVIYTLLLGFTVYSVVANYKRGFGEQKYMKQVVMIFSASSMVNSAWIFAWHYRMIGLSLMFMVVILVSLIGINLILKDQTYTKTQKLFVRLPFSIYFGWITVASIANVTTFLVDIQWDTFGIPENILTVVVLTVGAAIGVTAIKSYNDIAFGTVLLWAYAGILAKHISSEFFNGSYPMVIATLIGSLIVIAGFEFYMILSGIRRRVIQ